LLPLAETSLQSERFGTRHRAALGITEQTDAVVVVVSEENGQISLVERARIVRNLNEAQVVRAINTLLNPAGARRSLFSLGPLIRADERRRRGQLLSGTRGLFGRGPGRRPPSDEERAAAAAARANR
jgi:hypothetical protein